MSWLADITTDLVISTGDNKVYTPDWINATKGRGYNIARFEFSGIPGTQVDRGEEMGAQYNMEVFFQGEDHLDVAKDFERSAANKNPWTITHPYYGQLLVQPLELTLDNTAMNVTRVIVPVMETLSAKALQAVISRVDKVVADAPIAQATVSSSYLTEVPVPKVSTIQRLAADVKIARDKVTSIIQTAKDAADLSNYYDTFDAAVNCTAYDMATIIDAAGSVLGLLSGVNASVTNRLDAISGAYGEISDAVDNFIAKGLKLAKQLKKNYEHNGGWLVIGACVSTVTNYNYASRKEVAQVMDTVVNLYNDYVRHLDTIQSADGGDVDSYVPDPDSVQGVTDILDTTIAALLEIASDAKQERTKTLDADSNVMLEAYALYPDMELDVALDLLINTNSIGLEGDEILLLRKGRQLVYYV